MTVCVSAIVNTILSPYSWYKAWRTLKAHVPYSRRTIEFSSLKRHINYSVVNKEPKSCQRSLVMLDALLFDNNFMERWKRLHFSARNFVCAANALKIGVLTNAALRQECTLQVKVLYRKLSTASMQNQSCMPALCSGAQFAKTKFVIMAEGATVPPAARHIYCIRAAGAQSWIINWSRISSGWARSLGSLTKLLLITALVSRDERFKSALRSV